MSVLLIFRFRACATARVTNLQNVHGVGCVEHLGLRVGSEDDTIELHLREIP